MKRLFLLLLMTCLTVQAQIQKLSLFPSTNVLRGTDLIAISTAPGTGSEGLGNISFDNLLLAMTNRSVGMSNLLIQSYIGGAWQTPIRLGYSGQGPSMYVFADQFAIESGLNGMFFQTWNGNFVSVFMGTDGTWTFYTNITAARVFADGSYLRGMGVPYGTAAWSPKPARYFVTWNTFAWGTGDVRSLPLLHETNLWNTINNYKTNGMLAAGYDIIWLDDGWVTNSVAADGTIGIDLSKFPSGITNFAGYCHSNGFRMGVYSASIGGPTVGPGTPAVKLYGAISNQVSHYAAWGVDAIKVDYTGGALDELAEARQWNNAVMECGRKMILLITDSDYSNLFPQRASHVPFVNILETSQGFSTVGSIMTNCFTLATNILDLRQYTVAGHPGICVEFPVETTGATNIWWDTNQLQIQLTFAALLNSSIQAQVLYPNGTNLVCMTNTGMLSIQGDSAWSTPATQWLANVQNVWVKPLGSNGRTNAVAVFNFDTVTRATTLYATNCGLADGSVMQVQRCWDNVDGGQNSNSFSASVFSQAVNLYIVSTPAAGPIPGYWYGTTNTPTFNAVNGSRYDATTGTTYTRTNGAWVIK